jgi:hypothetical protein
MHSLIDALKGKWTALKDLTIPGATSGTQATIGQTIQIWPHNSRQAFLDQ